MARNRGKKALYEVIGKGGLRKPAPGGPVQPPPPPQEDRVDEPVVERPAEQEPAVTTWPKRPRIVQVNAGRIEFSLPYQVAIALLLGVVLVLLVAYRLGQMSYSSPAADDTAVAGSNETGKREPLPAAPPRTVAPPGPISETPETTGKGSNVILIKQYGKKRDLIPVQKHFDMHGIYTEIVQGPNGDYFLRTKERYDSFAPGTRGETDLNRVKRVGALYKADPGYESFETKRTKPFQDAYGMKVE